MQTIQFLLKDGTLETIFKAVIIDVIFAEYFMYTRHDNENDLLYNKLYLKIKIVLLLEHSLALWEKKCLDLGKFGSDANFFMCHCR